MRENILMFFYLACVQVATAARSQIFVCDIMTSQIRAGPAKVDEHKHDEREDIERKLDIFHILNGILAETKNLIFWKRFPGRIMDSFEVANGHFEKDFATFLARTETFFYL